MSVLQQASTLLNLFLNLRLLRWHSNALDYYYYEIWIWVLDYDSRKQRFPYGVLALRQ